jgi:hypothetical protein
MASSTAASSVIAGESEAPFVAELDRKAAKYSRLETIAAWIVIVGVVAEDWDGLANLFTHPFAWGNARIAIGGVAVAVGIAFELLFSSRGSSAERKIRDWYSIRVAELNVALEHERTERLRLEERLKLPRSLNDSASLIEKLSKLGEAQYVFTSVFQDEESALFLRSIDEVLQKSHWKRGPDVRGFPGVNIYGPQGLGVPIGFNTGIRISVEVPGWDSSMELRPFEKQPEILRQAVTLNTELFIHTIPLGPSSAPDRVLVQNGDPGFIMIAVGRKI